MEEVMTLILLSLAMLVGCYVAGSIPLVFTLSEEKLHFVTVLGAGLLVGTALAVIIPEGVHVLYSSAQSNVGVDKHLTDQDHIGPDMPHTHDHSDHSGPDVAHYIGISLVLGFLFMLIVDQIGGSHSRSQDSPDAESGATAKDRSPNITATLGLVVHAAADGIALGAAASTTHTDTEMIVFIAIMLHKAPAAFGLVSFLLHEGLERNRIRKHLLIFALAAPLLSVVTYFGLSQGNKETLSNTNATGITMLFSAGTFLYVATVHVLPGLKHSPEGGDRHEHGFRKSELLALLVGGLFPLLISFTHTH
ncbi:PREDICTED: zinc transporter ZIP9-like [Priapulus caudatus]|uniref:Zinc transporter ZIP9-like n=1 Tax=Priapulus caudatus TaxID=37621 RepID=A0ABM1EFP0_PRICU|nr:PREDICTED: zinc transporter ZIP9-like [Priapulus caudatus]